jgi:hypothetical protein
MALAEYADLPMFMRVPRAFVRVAAQIAKSPVSAFINKIHKILRSLEIAIIFSKFSQRTSIFFRGVCSKPCSVGALQSGRSTYLVRKFKGNGSLIGADPIFPRPCT